MRYLSGKRKNVFIIAVRVQCAVPRYMRLDTTTSREHWRAGKRGGDRHTNALCRGPKIRRRRPARGGGGEGSSARCRRRRRWCCWTERSEVKGTNTRAHTHTHIYTVSNDLRRRVWVGEDDYGSVGGGAVAGFFVRAI